jgi:hypothetical protein
VDVLFYETLFGFPNFESSLESFPYFLSVMQVGVHKNPNNRTYAESYLGVSNGHKALRMHWVEYHHAPYDRRDVVDKNMGEYAWYASSFSVKSGLITRLTS